MSQSSPLNHAANCLKAFDDGQDPSTAQGTEAERRLAFAEAYRMLAQRIGAFVNLPLESLDALATQRRLKEIGAMEGSTSVAKV